MSEVDPRKGRSIVRGKMRPADTAAQAPASVTYTISEAFSIFFSAKKAEGIRDRTVEDYETNWKYFTDWLEEDVPAIEITAETIRDYINYMSNKTLFSGVPNRPQTDKKLKTQTVITRIRTLRTVFTFLAEEGYIQTSPLAKVKMPRKDREDKPTFTDDDIRRLLDAPDTETYAGLRDRCLMMTLADGGFRVNEALRLTTEHLDIKARCFNLPGWMNKNRKPRIVPLSPETVRELLRLVNETRQYFDTDHIFVTNYGEPLKAAHFRKRLKAHAKAGGVDLSLAHPHQFRSYFITTYLLSGGDIFSCQRIVAHANIETTRGYAKLSEDNIRSQHAQYSPLARLGLRRISKTKQ
ncbi:tyrosine-type recombinase/integrase [Paenibacillus sp. NPDC057967]|uniref:tyrosine-type recombinase/integrase n=1 Tax=Paenibacillus sp. NPDC057967 TaxID=3346293 RepID=UPI0036DAE717